MGIEADTGYINSLDKTWPLATDDRNTADNHLRLIKSVLKNTFPNLDGVVNCTPDELNLLEGVVADDVMLVPGGTAMLFYQAYAPDGWTQVTTGLNATYGNMLRVVTGTGGTYGGTHSPILMDKVPSHTHIITASVDSQGGHTHDYVVEPLTNWNVYYTSSTEWTIEALLKDATPATVGAHTHTVTATAAANADAANWAPLYADVIIATKDDIT
jgi:hypothetical protein